MIHNNNAQLGEVCFRCYCNHYTISFTITIYEEFIETRVKEKPPWIEMCQCTHQLGKVPDQWEKKGAKKGEKVYVGQKKKLSIS